MDLRDRPEDEAFRAEVRAWLEDHVVGEFAALGGRGGSGDETFGFETRLAWEQGARGRRLDLSRLAGRVRGPGRDPSPSRSSSTRSTCGPTPRAGSASSARDSSVPPLIQYGTDAQKARFLPPIRWGTELWCQGYSEPDAGSDLANVQTKAVLDGDEWVVTGQKVWTSLAHQADWCFVVCRTDPGSTRHRGLSYLLVPMDQPGVEVRPITQLTRTSEFNEVFFDGARTAAEHVVGEVGDGWRVALATLAFERGVGLLGASALVPSGARPPPRGGPSTNGADRRPGHPPASGPLLRPSSRSSATTPCGASPAIDGPVAPPEASIIKLYWATWHRDLGELAMDVLRDRRRGRAEAAPYELDELQRIFLFSRSDTIYGGSNEIQRNIIGERVLGLPPEPKVDRTDRAEHR